MVIKFLIIVSIFVVSSVSHSQHWLFRVKPIIGSNILSFQRFDKIVYDPVIDFSNGFKAVNQSFTDNILLRPDYNLEFFVDFYQINENWRIGSGFKVYTGSGIFLSVDSYQNNSAYVRRNSIFLGNLGYGFGHNSGPVDFNTYALATRKLNFQLNERENILHFLSLGLGFTKNKKSDLTRISNPQGKMVREANKSHNYFPCMLFKYELEFTNKKGKNLFSFALNYQQGIYKVAKLTHYDIFDVGPLHYQSATTRGSSISLNIIKPFYIKRKKKLKN